MDNYILLPDKKKLIDTWYDYSNVKAKEKDFFSAYIALWIAFNGLCFHIYSKDAKKYQPRFGSKYVFGNFNLHTKESTHIEGEYKINDNQKVFINLKEPEINLEIKKDYNEEKLFNLFVEDFSPDFDELVKKNKIREYYDNLHSSVKKENGFYVQDMSKEDKEDARAKLDFNIENIKDVLYQIRCNLFHGQKDTSQQNEQEIVKSAYFVLKVIMEKMFESSLK